jgi:hypothetical protein
MVKRWVDIPLKLQQIFNHFSLFIISLKFRNREIGTICRKQEKEATIKKKYPNLNFGGF